MKITKYIIIAAGVAILCAWYFWPKKHKSKLFYEVVKTHATWFINPVSGKDTSSIVFREVKDTNVKIDDTINDSYKMVIRRDTNYYVPFKDTMRDYKGFPMYDSSKKRWRDTTIFRAYPSLYIIHDDDKHY